MLVGLIGMIDPAREEAREAVLTASRAGIRPVMITGDQPLTAAAIARQVGILGDQEWAGSGGAATDGAATAEADAAKVLTGAQLAALSVEQLSTTVDGISVFARVAPGAEAEHRPGSPGAGPHRRHDR